MRMSFSPFALEGPDCLFWDIAGFEEAALGRDMSVNHKVSITKENIMKQTNVAQITHLSVNVNVWGLSDSSRETFANLLKKLARQRHISSYLSSTLVVLVNVTLLGTS